jgi:hypothetical protein
MSLTFTYSSAGFMTLIATCAQLMTAAVWRNVAKVGAKPRQVA